VSTTVYTVVVCATVAFSGAMALRPWLVAITRVDSIVLRAIARLRFDALTSVADAVNEIGTSWFVRVVAWTTIAVLIVYRRFRYLAVYLGVLLAGTLTAAVLSAVIGRPRPLDVSILVDWDGYSYPSRTVTAFALVTIGALYTTIPSGHPRRIAKPVFAAVVIGFAAVRLYLGVDHPTDVLAALALGWAWPTIAFRWVTPEEAFAVTYRRARPAHLDVSGRRGAAIVQALDQQLGLTVVRVEPFGQAASAGSTPLRLTVTASDGSERALFAKLYALAHLRADRWYKATRTVLYGRLEDEKPFSTVRRLAEYEDHMLRLFRDAGVPSPTPFGFAEITPEREYIIVMEFFDGATDIPREVDVALIDDALTIVRRLWDAGIAHRDIKPSNLLARDTHVLLIDVAFAAVRPTPWRQAVDLANMMLTLALSSTPELVYERARRQFDANDIAEAFAATHSVTIPTQLRRALRDDGRDLIGSFRRLAPRRAPIRIQVWTVRRVAVTLGAVALVAAAVAASLVYAQVAGLL
jgi:tRNA A-37 threonylcarbamoyl transferase component Bud32/membrane-associated phospholipid phosphatase